MSRVPAEGLPGAPPRRVWKYPLAVRVEQTVEMPMGARVIHVAEQWGKPMVWAEVIGTDTFAKAYTRPRRFYIIGTGHVFDTRQAQIEYRGTVLLQRGHLVLHVYEEVGLG